MIDEGITAYQFNMLFEIIDDTRKSRKEIIEEVIKVVKYITVDQAIILIDSWVDKRKILKMLAIKTELHMTSLKIETGLEHSVLIQHIDELIKLKIVQIKGFGRIRIYYINEHPLWTPIDRSRIQEIFSEEMSNLDLVDDEIGKPTVFTDETKLSAEYLPENLLHRTEILKTMARHFKTLFYSIGSSRRMAIIGPVGTGKTSTAKAFGLWAQAKGKKENFNIKYVHINCRRNRTPFMILLAITRKLNSHVPTRGYSADELMEMIIELLEVKQSTMLLVLDEIDYAVDRGSENLLYALTRTSDDRLESKHRIALILISRSTNYLSKLDSETNSSLSAAIVELYPYTNSELLDILHDRVAVSFIKNRVSDEAMLLTAEIAAVKGDARRALEIMWYAGKFANIEGSTIVYPEHIRYAKANIEPSLLRTALKDMTLHKLLLLIAICRALKESKTAFVTIEEAEDNYQIVCKEYLEDPRKVLQIWEYLKEFDKLSLLVTKKSIHPKGNRIQLLAITNASVVEIEQEVIKQIETMNRT